MSDVSGGTGWWQASDGKWYPPQSTPLPPPPAGAPQTMAAPNPMYAVAPQRTSNGLATAALVLGIIAAVLGLIPFLFLFSFTCGILGIVFGFIGRSRSRESGVGRKSALTGIITGALGIVLAIVGVVFIANIGDDAVDELEKIGRCLENPELAECD